MAMPPGMWELLQKKYAIAQQGADTDRFQAETGRFNADSTRLGVTADANLANVRAGLLPDQSAAEIARMKAEAALTGKQVSWFDRKAQSDIDMNSANVFATRAQGGLYGAQAGQVGQMTRLLPRPSSMGGFGWGSKEEDAIRSLYSRDRLNSTFGWGN